MTSHRPTAIKGPFVTFAALVREAMIAANISGTAVVQATSISHGTLSAWRAGMALPASLDRLNEFIAATGCQDTLQDELVLQWNLVHENKPNRKVSREHQLAARERKLMEQTARIEATITRMNLRRALIEDEQIQLARERTDIAERRSAMLHEHERLDRLRIQVNTEIATLEALKVEIAALRDAAPEPDEPVQMQLVPDAELSDLELVRLNRVLADLRNREYDNAEIIAGVLNAVARITEQADMQARKTRRERIAA